MSLTLADVRGIGARLSRAGCRFGAAMSVPAGDFRALSAEVDALLTPPGEEPEAKPRPDHVLVRTVCGEIRVYEDPKELVKIEIRR